MFNVNDLVEINDIIECTEDVKFLESLRGEKFEIQEKIDSDPDLTMYFLKSKDGKTISHFFNGQWAQFPFIDADLQLAK